MDRRIIGYALLAAAATATAGGCEAPADDSETHEQAAINAPGCYVAFIHGSGSEYQNDPAASYEFWRPKIFDSAQYAENMSLIKWTTLDGRRCKWRAIGYFGKGSWHDQAPPVTAQLQDFIDRERIPDRKLILVTHSMGGLVARFILNSGEPGAPTHQPAYERVKNKVAYAITLQAPHRGSEAADSLYGEASAISANAGGITIRMIGIQGATDARSTMRRGYVESALRRWLGDEGRTTPIYTVGGTDTNGAKSRLFVDPVTEEDDEDCDLASTILFWGQESDFANDGAVEARSAHGQSIQKERKWTGFFRYNNDHIMAGALRRWVNTPLNHNHGRLASINRTDFTDMVSGRRIETGLADKLRNHGLALPCSDPETRNERPEIARHCQQMGL